MLLDSGLNFEGKLLEQLLGYKNKKGNGTRMRKNSPLVYPQEKGSVDTVFCTPYNSGPHSLMMPKL